MINCKKLLAMFLIFTLTFSNFAFAANGFISLFGNSKKNENVEFSAYLENGEETSSPGCFFRDPSRRLERRGEKIPSHEGSSYEFAQG